MKLIHKLNLSFGILLACVLLLTAGLVYPLLLDKLIDKQRQELISQGNAMMDLVNSLPAQSLVPTQSSPASIVLPAKDITRSIDALLIESNQNILFSTMSEAQSKTWLPLIEQNLTHNQQGLWEDGQEKYIVETVTSNPQMLDPASTAIPSTLVLSTPLSKVKSYQTELFTRLIFIMIFGGILAFGLSFFITKRMVTPLEKLKLELQKIEKRHFDEVRLVQTGGEIGEVAHSVHHLAGELKQYHYAQKQFFQNASHELKTPLMTIQGYAEGIRDGIFIGERADNGLKVITSECERLKGIVTEMILLAKLESEDGILNQEVVPVKHLVDQTVDRVRPLALNDGVEIIINYTGDEPTNLQIHGDSKKLLQAVLNIMSNAIRHASQFVYLNISEQNGQVQIEIKDDGEGISELLLPHLFQRFIKGKNGETGLGLAISRAIVERCNGVISAHNGEHSGAIFRMSFPSK